MSENEEPAAASLLEQAKGVLAANDQGAFTAPEAGLYPHQWLWDSCFVSIGLRHFDVERAKSEILSLLRGQWSSGMVPNMILNPRGERVGDGKIWRSWLNPNSPDGVTTSGITQPPMLAEAVVRIGEKLKLPERRSWYRAVFPALVRYHEWLYVERDPHGEGLVLLIHPWESGMDNSPPWMGELHDHLLPWWISWAHKLKLDNVFGWLRRDRKFVNLGERTSNVDALALYGVQRRLRRKNYDFARIIDHSLFAVEDLAFNSILVRANAQLQTIAKTLREELPAGLLDSMHKTEQALEQLWDEQSSEYFSRDFVAHRLIKESSIAALLPLYAGCVTQDRAAELVKMLENEHRFGPAYPVPSVPLDSPWFARRTYWQGPVWLNTNWLIIDGLRRYGYADHAAALTESTLELVQKGGCFEYFDPISGDPAGTNNFSTTAALAIDLLEK